MLIKAHAIMKMQCCVWLIKRSHSILIPLCDVRSRRRVPCGDQEYYIWIPCTLFHQHGENFLVLQEQCWIILSVCIEKVSSQYLSRHRVSSGWQRHCISIPCIFYQLGENFLVLETLKVKNICLVKYYRLHVEFHSLILDRSRGMNFLLISIDVIGK